MFSNFKKIFNKTNFGLALFFIASTASAQTTDVDNYKPLIGAGLYSDFKSNYSPDVLNATVANGVYTLRSRHGGLAQPRVKIFIPPGAKKLRTSILLYAADQPARAAARFASPPVSLITDIGSNANGNATTSKTLEILLNNPNQELLFYSPERSGLLMVATADSESSYQSTTGGYIYINFFMIPGSRFMSFDAQVEVDQACYTNWYQSINNSNAWNSAGNPQDGVRYTCAGGGTVTPPVLTGITLSRLTWNATTDANNTSITVTPQPAGAVLRACTSSNASVLTVGAAAGQFVINPAAVTMDIDPRVTITCDGKTASLTLQPIDPNNFVLKYTLTRPQSELTAATNTNFWVAAKVPRTGFPYGPSDGSWFFFKEGTGWVLPPLLPNPLSVAYQQNKVPVAETAFVIPVGLPESVLKDFDVEFYLGYQDASGNFVNKGVIWDKNRTN